MSDTPSRRLPLDGVRVIELGQLLAGPFTGTLLAYFGADVVKVEPPGGDPIRGWRKLDENGTSFWWRSLGRNKKSVTLDLKTDQGKALARRLMVGADVVIENFRPGTMENWGLGPDSFATDNPGLIYTRISGYGQTGPYANKPGYASVCEGIGGLRYVNGFPGERPVRPNLSLGDTIAGLHAALGILLALFERQNSARGQVVDIALYESVFNLLEGVIPEFDGAGVIREPAGSTVTGIVPTNTYRCADRKFVVIGGNGDSIFKRLMAAAGRRGVAAAKTGGAAILAEARVPSGPIYSVADMMEDPHFQARGLCQQVEINGKPLKVPAITPRLADTPGKTRWPGGEVGSHNHSVLRDELGLSDAEFAELQAQGIIG